MHLVELAYANRSILYSKIIRLSRALDKKRKYFRRIFTVAGIRALREDSLALRLTSELVDLRAANVHRRICFANARQNGSQPTQRARLRVPFLGKKFAVEKFTILWYYALHIPALYNNRFVKPSRLSLKQRVPLSVSFFQDILLK